MDGGLEDDEFENQVNQIVEVTSPLSLFSNNFLAPQ